MMSVIIHGAIMMSVMKRSVIMPSVILLEISGNFLKQKDTQNNLKDPQILFIFFCSFNGLELSLLIWIERS